ncbi:MAG: ABC transporter ATP-binding protein/permease, partial [Malacoplasma sp.]|nr:ABC transporter ATP-binding protein/permease [Malacoplasma sp.]
ITLALSNLISNNLDPIDFFGIDLVISNVDVLYMLGGILLAFYFLNAFFNFLMNFILAKIANKIGYHQRMDLFNKIQLLQLQYFDTHESGNIMSILTNDVFNIVIFISQNFGQLIFGITTMLGMMIIMFLVSPYLTLIAIGLILVFSVYIFYMSTKSVKSFFKQQEKLGKINGYIEEILSSQIIVNLFRKEKLTEKNFDSINKSLQKESERAQAISGLFIPWMNFLANFSAMVMTAISVAFIIGNIPLGSNIFGDIENANSAEKVVVSISVINAFILALRNFVQPINNIVGMIAQIQQALAGARRTSEVFLIDNEENNQETINVGKLKGEIKIKNLDFNYIPNKKVLKNINLDVKPGQTIAIVGPTGSGKTTIINLLTKFYDITDGDIIFDNEYNIKQITKKSLREQVSIVLQDTYLFSDTVKENIRYAKKEATDQEIEAVSKVANCHSFIMQLKNGYETKLTENASELSQGQKQLIAIARAMLSDSSILILDEATSNIDTRTEKIVQDAMNKLISRKTAFVIAHRLSTIKNADKIVVIKNGEIIEMGNHDELIKLKGFYYNLSTSKSGVIDENDM